MMHGGAGGQASHGGGQASHGGGQPSHGGGQPSHVHGGGQPVHGGGQPSHGGGQQQQQQDDAGAWVRRSPPCILHCGVTKFSLQLKSKLQLTFLFWTRRIGA